MGLIWLVLEFYVRVFETFFFTGRSVCVGVLAYKSISNKRNELINHDSLMLKAVKAEDETRTYSCLFTDKASSAN